MTSYVNSYVEKTHLLRPPLGDVRNQPIKRLMAALRNGSDDDDDDDDGDDDDDNDDDVSTETVASVSIAVGSWLTMLQEAACLLRQVLFTRH